MKRLPYSLALTLLFYHCYIGAQSQTVRKDNYQFDFVSKIHCGKVEDQGSTGTCWSFSTLSFIESEMVRMGKPLIDLSEMFYVRLNYIEKAEQYLRYQGNNTFGEGSLSHDILRLYRKYGAMPEIAYSGLQGGAKRHNHARLEADLKKFLDDLLSGRSIGPDWKDGLNQILDEHLGPLPQTFAYDGKSYNPISFADQYIGINTADYISVTSFNHHPVYESFVLEIPDNYSHERFYNVTLQDLTEIADHSLEEGYSVVWDCDVSEKGFSARQGLAIVPMDEETANSKQAAFDQPSMEKEITSDLRQEEFDNYSLTDDHLMHIVGSAKDQNGKLYYYVKNSWGESVGMEGYLFASQPYFQLNTISLTVHKDMIPASIAEKLSLPDQHPTND